MALGSEQEHYASTTSCSCAVASAQALWVFRTSTTSVLITSVCIDLPLTLTMPRKIRAMAYHNRVKDLHLPYQSSEGTF